MKSVSRHDISRIYLVLSCSCESGTSLVDDRLLRTSTKAARAKVRSEQLVEEQED